MVDWFMATCQREVYQVQVSTKAETKRNDRVTRYVCIKSKSPFILLVFVRFMLNGLCIIIEGDATKESLTLNNAFGKRE